MKKFIVVLSILICMLCQPLYGAEYSPSDLRNPMIGENPVHIADPDGLLSRDAFARIEQRIDALERNTSVQVAVVVVGSTGELTDADFAGELFDKWKIGYKDKDNGVLLLVAADDHAVRIHTGYGVEGALPDIAAKKIIDRDFIPAMREGSIDNAVESTVAAISDVVSDPTVRDELMSDRQVNMIDNSELEGLRYLFGGVVLIFFIAALIVYVGTRRRAAKAGDRYHSAIIMQGALKALVLFSIFSLGLALPFLLLCWIGAKRFRNKPEKCSVCGATMHKLNEEEDNSRLSDAQDLEEQLNSVDYDVWECPKCDAHTIYAYHNPSSTYTECPVCHTRAMKLAGTRTLSPATSHREGVGEKIYECMYCHHRKNDRFRIPRKPSAVETAAALGALGAISRGGGGGSFGGGFGGGMSGGGGASGRW